MITVVAPSPQKGSLASRTIVTVLTAGGFAAFCWADATALLDAAPGWWLAPAAVILGWGGAAEALRMAGRPAGLVVPAATAAVPLAAIAAASLPSRLANGPAAGLGWAAAAATAGMGVVCGTKLYGYRPGRDALGTLAAGALALVAIGMPLACMAGLRLLDTDHRAGLLPLVSMVAVVKGGDIAAYIIGSLVGRHKMAPIVSPGKTWEGALASLAASLMAAWLLLDRSAWAVSPGPWGGWLVYGLAVGGAGMLGDLSESLVKRELGVKDSGRSLGGLGGYLDLVDAALFAAPVAWMLWVLGTAA